MKKNEELLNIMQELEEEKPVGWGFKKNKADEAAGAGDEFSKYEDSISQAIKKLELNEKKEKAKKDYSVNQTL